ncbi:MAG: response regulator [Candidatus Cyclobacteriaceae bacterium M2_1C_046]
MSDKKTLLAIDDDDNFNHLVKRCFKKLDLPVKIISKTSGAEGLDYLKEYDNADLVLLDIRMPEMDGFEVLKQLDNNFPDKKLPVVMLSSSYRKEDREKAFKNKRVIDYFEKPMQLKKLEELITTLYTKYISRDIYQ